MRIQAAFCALLASGNQGPGEAGAEGAAGHRAAAGAGARPACAEAARRHAQPHGGAAEGAGASHGAPGALLCRRAVTGRSHRPQRPCRPSQYTLMLEAFVFTLLQELQAYEI